MAAKRAETLKEFAASIGVSYDSVFRASRDGRLKVIRFGKRLLVPAAEADRVAREGLRPRTSVSA
jgi:predicted site-specific integrase-resolvase